MKINNKEVKTNGYFAYDGCHKLYILTSQEDIDSALLFEYYVLPIKRLKEAYDISCELRYIASWDLDTLYCDQGENAEIVF